MVQEQEMDVDVKFKGKVIFKGKLCKNFFSKFRGLMFSKKLKKSRCLIFVNDFQSRINSSIHMLFVFFPIDVVFLDFNYEVVDVRTAYPFISFIMPKKKAKYVIEMNKGENILKVKDRVIF